MTEKELNNLYYIEKRINKLRARIQEIELDIGLSGVKYDGMPHSSAVNNPTEQLVINKCRLLEQLNDELVMKVNEERRIRKFIENIPDEEVKLIMEYRFINLLGWYEIAERLHMDRTTASKKMRKYLS